MPKDDAERTGEVRSAWYADKAVPVLMYRVNRRPLPPDLFNSGVEPPPFLDHLTECLLFGQEVVTSGRGHDRRWMLGNREIDVPRGYIAGWVGYRTPDAETEDEYDNAAKAWRTNVVERERRATAPFAVMEGQRFLFVARHPTFAPATPAKVFEMLLNLGEAARSVQTTDWAVEPVLDTRDFQQWLTNTAVLDSVAFHVRLPNPDAAESFAQIADHLAAQDAAALDHKLTPRSPERGLNKDFTTDPISFGLMEMARRAFAVVNAKGRNVANGVRTYNQRDRVRNEPVMLPGEHDAAQAAIVEHALNRATSEEVIE